MNYNHDDQGVQLFYKNKKIIINSLAKTEVPLTDDELLNYAGAMLKFNQDLGRISSDELQPKNLQISNAKSLYEIQCSVPFYKYISQFDFYKN